MSAKSTAEWAIAPRWSGAHLIPVNAEGEDFRGAVYVWTVCGRRVNEATVDVEPTGIDTMNRCARCLTRAAEHGADDQP